MSSLRWLLCACLALTGEAAQAQARHPARARVEKLSAPLPELPVGIVKAPQISPDGAWALYLADNDQTSLYDLERSPIDGSAPAIQMSAPLVPGGSIDERYLVSPDSNLVVYRADQGRTSVSSSSPCDSTVARAPRGSAAPSSWMATS
jgi:hypothetical protein